MKGLSSASNAVKNTGMDNKDTFCEGLPNLCYQSVVVSNKMGTFADQTFEQSAYVLTD